MSSDTTDIVDDLDADLLSSEPSLAQPTTHSNDASTFHLFRFKRYGDKMIKSANTKRKYYKCNMDTFGCRAKRIVDFSCINKDDIKAVSYENEHNHGPVPDPKTRPEVKEAAILQMSAGASAVNVHKQAVNNAPLPLSSADVPSKAQLKTWKYRNAMKDMPTSMHAHFFLSLLSS